MQAFKSITSTAIPLDLKDVDTDMIIPAQYLTATSSQGFGQHLFQRLRDNDPSFVLNQKKYEKAQILVSSHNFGCGSSREHAVWAILGWGIRVVIASSYADIFSSNSAKNGLVLIKLSEQIVEKILQKTKQVNYQITVDLNLQQVILPENEIYHFDFDPFRKDCILNGFDDLDYIQTSTEDVAKWYEARQEKLFLNNL